MPQARISLGNIAQRNAQISVGDELYFQHNITQLWICPSDTEKYYYSVARHTNQPK